MQHHKRESPSKGYTLIEVCLVLLLITLIVSLVPPVRNLPSSLQVRYELDRLATVLRYLQWKAAVEQATYTVTLGTTSYIADKKWQLSSPVRFGSLPGVKGPPYRPTKEINKGCEKGCEKFSILPGRISSGAVYLTDGTCQYALTVDASEIICIRKYRYRNRWECIN